MTLVLKTKGKEDTLSATLSRLKKAVKTHRERPYHHQQFNHAMKKAVAPVLLNAVASGELSCLDCGKIETQINKSLINPHFQIDQKYLNFIIGKLKSNNKPRQSQAV